MAAFVGMVPADAPRLIVAVVLDEPRGVHTGGAVAAPVFREVAAYAVEQLAVPGEGAE
jgi:cell division protein FtsI (penicillin-binding protein 3)